MARFVLTTNKIWLELQEYFQHTLDLDIRSNDSFQMILFNFQMLHS